MTKNDYIKGICKCYELLSLDYHDYLKYDEIFRLCNMPTDFYSVLTGQKKQAMGILKPMIISSRCNDIDLMEIVKLDRRYETQEVVEKPKVKRKNGDIYPFEYPEFKPAA